MYGEMKYKYKEKEMSDNNNSSTLVIGLLGIVFITLKLIGIINWSWWWVLAPFWMPFGMTIVLLVGLIVGLFHD